MTDTAAPETSVRALDQQGNDVLVPRDQWVAEVLPGMIRNAWDSPDQLYFVIVNSLNENFVAEVAAAAQHLHETDPVPARGTCVWGATLIALDRLVEAEMVLAGFLDLHGEDVNGAGSVLVNLAKVYQAKGENDRAESTLQRALAADPNEDNALGWLAGLTRQREGEAAAHAVIERMAQHPRSWRPQLWLALQALAANDSPRALQLYTEALAHTPQPIPPELLVQMSGDLGNHSQSNPALLDDLIALTTPHFIPEVHGLQVGNNLIKANVDRGHFDTAAAVVQSLAALSQPEWKQPLAFWQTELARLRGEPAADPQQPQAEAQAQAQVQIGMVRIDGPIWLSGNSAARTSFPAKSTQAPTVTFLGGSAESPDTPSASEPAAPLSHYLAHLTRSLPLFLAEQTHMRSAAAARAILPWAVADGSRPGGFIVAGQPWPDPTAVQAALQADTAHPTDLVVTVHLDAEVTPWEVSLTFLRTADSTRIGELTAEFAPDSPTAALHNLAGEMIELLAVLGPAQSSPAYILPPDLPAYLSALDQLLTLRCATMPAAPIPSPETRQTILAAAQQLATANTQPTTLLLTEIESSLKHLSNPN